MPGDRSTRHGTLSRDEIPLKGAIDCDLHPALPATAELLPYLDDYWRDQFANRHIDRLALHPDQLSAEFAAVRAARTGASTGHAGRRSRPAPAQRARSLRHALRDLQPAAWRDRAVQRGHGGRPLRRGERLGREGAARPRAAAARLDPGAAAQSASSPSRRSSASPPTGASCRCCCWSMGDMLLGRRIHWPIYAAAEKHGLADRHPRRQHLSRAPTHSGWPAYRVEDYVAQSAAFESQLVEPPRRRRVPEIPEAEAGADRIRLHLAADAAVAHRQDRGAACAPRFPWIDRSPAEIMREHVRFTLQPIDAPETIRSCSRARSSISAPTGCCCSRPTIRTGSSTATTCCPTGCRTDTMRRILIDNPLETYPRLREER